MLTRFGMRESDILNFSLDKFKVYIDQVMAIDNRERIERVVDTYQAASGLFDGKSLKEHLALLK